MGPKIKKYLIGNWKMHGLLKDQSFCEDLIERTRDLEDIELAICPPATLIHPFVQRFEGSRIGVGAQDCHAQKKGAHTGDISGQMIADCGASYVIVGHSERRRDHHETSRQVAKKTSAAQKAGLIPIVCVGEVLDKRQSGEAVGFVVNQLSRSLPSGSVKASSLIIAYEPVWAIGTGLTPSLDDISVMHTALRSALTGRFGLKKAQKIPILYGGSVTADKANILTLDQVDGALIGGASLTVDKFAGIAEAYLKI